MKKILIPFLLGLCLPVVSWGYDDSCSYPDKYTVDKRCYVTEEQKKEHPYNAVVSIVGEELCSGVVVNRKDGDLYVYTAKHCVNDKNGIPKSTVDIKTQDGKIITVEIIMVGKYKPAGENDEIYYVVPDMYSSYVDGATRLTLLDGNNPECTGRLILRNGKNLLSVDKECVDEFGVAKAVISVKNENGMVMELEKIEEYIDHSKVQQNFAIYIVPEKYKDITSVVLSSKSQRAIVSGPHKIIGYSSLKIMSDTEIKEFKQNYVNYLREKKGVESKGTEGLYGFYRGGMNFNNTYSRGYLYHLNDNETSYYRGIFNDINRLKQLTYTGLLTHNCHGTCSGWESTQAWSASSSAGIFDKYGDLYGIHNQRRTTMGVTDGGDPDDGVFVHSISYDSKPVALYPSLYR